MDRRWMICLLKNLLRVFLLLTAVSIVTFWLMKSSPVDPLQANVGQAALGSMSREQVAKLEEYWGFIRLRWNNTCPGLRTLCGGIWAFPCCTGSR